MKHLMTLLTVAMIGFLAFFVYQHNALGPDMTEAVVAANATLTEIEVLHQHRLKEGSIMLSSAPDQDYVTLSFLTHGFLGVQHVASATIPILESQDGGLTFAMLPKSENVPFTIYAGITTNPDLTEILVTEPGFGIAHGVQLTETETEGLYAWITTSPDFTGESFTIIGVAADGRIIGDVEHDGTQLTIHPVNTTEAH